MDLGYLPLKPVPESIETNLQKAQRRLDLDVCWFVSGFVVGLQLVVGRPEFWVISILVPPETDDIVDVLDALTVAALLRPSQDLQFCVHPGERLPEELLDLEIGNDGPRSDSGRSVPEVGCSGDVLQTLFESSEPCPSCEPVSAGK